jgi:hypothetical protein
MTAAGPRRSVVVMKKRLLLIALGLALVTLALGGWTLTGLRRAGRLALRPAFAV